MTQKFLVRAAGETRQATALAASAGAADAGKIPALDSAGRHHRHIEPAGIGTDTAIITAFEALSAGVFVNLFSNSGEMNARLADNSNGRPADGFVLEAVAADADATVYPLDGINYGLSGLTAGNRYWLGTAGGVISTPLDETDNANANKISQYLGKARSVTELISTDDGWVVL